MYHAYTLFATYCHPTYLSLFTTGGGHGSLSQSQLKPRREHKRLKHWGKKNKKLRDKDLMARKRQVMYHTPLIQQIGQQQQYHHNHHQYLVVGGRGRPLLRKNTAFDKNLVYLTGRHSPGLQPRVLIWMLKKLEGHHSGHSLIPHPSSLTFP